LHHEITLVKAFDIREEVARGLRKDKVHNYTILLGDIVKEDEVG
jgi:hypothetical protein